MCPECEPTFKQLEEAWKVIEEFQRRLLIIGNAVRGTDRYLNGRKHQGQSSNRARDGVESRTSKEAAP